MKKLDGCIIDCRYFDHQWIFMKQRHDRNHPNGRRAIMGKPKLDILRQTKILLSFWISISAGKMEALENAVSRDLLLATLENSRALE